MLLLARVHKAKGPLKALEQQQAELLLDYAQKDITIAELKVELARPHQYLESLSLTIQWQEHLRLRGAS